MPDRIVVLVDGCPQPAMPTEPAVHSRFSGWKGFQIESHSLPPFEMADHYIPFHIVCMSIGERPVQRFWREGGCERYSTLSKGTIQLRSPGELKGCRWTAPYKMIAVAIDPVLKEEIWSGVLPKQGL